MPELADKGRRQTVTKPKPHHQRAVVGAIVGVIGVGLVIGGVWIYDSIMEAKGKSNPRDLEKGMSPTQKGAFQREIEQEKMGRGMRPNDNLPWEILVMLADYVRQSFR